MGRRIFFVVAALTFSCAGERIARNDGVIDVIDAGVVDDADAGVIMDAGVIHDADAGAIVDAGVAVFSTPKVRRDFCCTEAIGTPVDAAAKCTATPECSYGAALICRGVEAPPSVHARENAERKACRMRCACTCPEDVRHCAMVP